MTTTYDPHDPTYLDEASVREELTRVFDLCHGCRLCFKFCSSFPTLFSYIDRYDDQDAARLTKAEQDQVVDECFQCKLCYVNCPYIPGQSEWALDFPRLMLRTDAMRHATGQVSKRQRLTDAALGRTDAVGKVATTLAPVANRLTSGARPDGAVRKLMAKVTGVSSKRLLPPYAKQRFTTWFRKRAATRIANKQGTVAVFPTCLVEYQQPSVGQDLVRVLERNRVETSLVDGARCCGAPWLHAGDLDAFTKQAQDNVTALAAAIRAGNDVVVPQPTCGYVLKKDYVDYVGGPDAQLVAEHTYDACEYLMKLHKGEGTSLDTAFSGPVPATITYHTPCHLRAQNIGLKSRDLLKLTGAKITLAQQCSGIDGMWGLREENYERSVEVGRKLAAEIEQAASECVAGDCHLANGAITELTGQAPLHPISIIARAYGFGDGGATAAVPRQGQEG